MTGKKLPNKQKNSMRVCVLIDAWEPLWGGGPTNAWEISRRLTSEKHWYIDIFTRSLKKDGLVFDRFETYNNQRLRIIRVGPTTSFFNLFSRIIWLGSVMVAVWHNHQQQPYDVIHAHAYSAGIPGKLLNILLRIPIVFTVHGSNNLDLGKKSIVAILERFILTGISYSRQISVSKLFLRYGNVNRIVVIPNGVEINNFNLAKSKNHRNNIFIFLYVGRFDHVKGVDILIKAFDMLHKKYQQTQLQLVGYGYNEGEIKKLVSQYRLGKSVIFRGKQIPQSLIHIYLTVDVVVVPSRSEGQSIVILEAFAAKKPVIATNVGDNAYFVKQGETGFLVVPSDIDGLYQALIEAYCSKNLRMMGINGYHIAKKYSWNIAVKKTKNIYESLV